jgi:hypothetical protein
MTLSGNQRDIIGDALRSVVAQVDRCLIIDTGITDDTIEVARAIAGDKLIVRSFPWRNDFGAARNFALAAAAETGADWAVTVDSDERLECGAVDLRTALATRTEEALLAPAMSMGVVYPKSRFFRLPARGRYTGLTHEYIAPVDGHGALAGIVVRELAKTWGTVHANAARNIPLLSQTMADDPTSPRWPGLLGHALAAAGRHEAAPSAYRAAAALSTDAEEGVTALCGAAIALALLGRYDEAVQTCAAGVARHAGLAELPWLAATVSLAAGRLDQAAYWAYLAIGLGCFAGVGSAVPRTHSCYALSHLAHPTWEGPYDVLVAVFQEWGDSAAVEAVARDRDAAQQARIAASPDPAAAAASALPLWRWTVVVSETRRNDRRAR